MSVNISIMAFVFLMFQFLIFAKKKSRYKQFMELFFFTAFTEIFLDLGFIMTIANYEINFSYISIIISTIYGLFFLRKF